MQLTYSSYKKYTFELGDELGKVIYIGLILNQIIKISNQKESKNVSR